MIARLLTISGFFETPTCRLTVLHSTLCIKKIYKNLCKEIFRNKHFSCQKALISSCLMDSIKTLKLAINKSLQTMKILSYCFQIQILSVNNKCIEREEDEQVFSWLQIPTLLICEFYNSLSRIFILYMLCNFNILINPDFGQSIAII